MLLVGSVAMAEPAGTPSFVPVSTGGSGTGDDSVVVEPGDHLWKISEHHLDAVLGRAAEPAEIDPYWRSVIELNRDHIQSGDPDLIYPGEVISLPASGQRSATKRAMMPSWVPRYSSPAESVPKVLICPSWPRSSDQSRSSVTWPPTYSKERIHSEHQSL